MFLMINLDPTAHLIPPINDQDHCWEGRQTIVTLVEYGDYTCQQCLQAYPLIQSIQAQFSEVCFVFRHFPSPRHPASQHAAEAAEAAGVQGKFWEMHDRLMCQRQIADDASLIEHAIALRLDINRFLHDMSTDVHVERVLSDYKSGIGNGVNCTPAFFINGFRLIGDWRQSALQTTIEYLLS